MPDSSSLWPHLITALPAFVLAAGTALGVWWNRRGVVAVQDLTIVQIDVARATVGKTEAEAIKAKAEAESMAVSSLAKALDVADKTVDKLKAQCEAMETRAEAAEARIAQLLEEQKERHRMANELHDLKIRWALLDAGVPFADVQKRDIPRIYPEAEGGGCF